MQLCLQDVLVIGWGHIRRAQSKLSSWHGRPAPCQRHPVLETGSNRTFRYTVTLTMSASATWTQMWWSQSDPRAHALAYAYKQTKSLRGLLTFGDGKHPIHDVLDYLQVHVCTRAKRALHSSFRSCIQPEYDVDVDPEWRAYHASITIVNTARTHRAPRLSSWWAICLLALAAFLAARRRRSSL